MHISPSSMNCAWAAYSYVPWIQLGTSNASGQGPGNVPFIVAGNPGALPRSGQILIGDQTLTINQAAGPGGTINSYTMSAFAGGGSNSTPNLGDGGPATSAVLNSPTGLAFDAVTGNLYIADTGNSRVRVVMPDLSINTLAGGGASTAENVPALTALLRQTSAVGLDNSGAVYVNDFSTRIRQIKLGNIATFAGTTSSGFSGDSGPATSALMSSPSGIVSDTNGNVYIADSGNNRVREVSGGTITTIAGGGTGALGDQGPATSATLAHPGGLAFDASGNLYIADQSNSRVRKIANGVITTVAGGGSGADGGPATSASLYNPAAVAFDPAGNMFIAESYRLRRVATDGTISTTIQTNNYNSGGVAADRAGNVYFSDYYYGKVWKLSPVPSFCSYVISTPGVQTSNGGTLSISVTAAAGCNWTASSDLPWATISSGTSGSGNGTVSLTIGSNATGQARTGSIIIAGQSVLLTQNVGCAFAFSSTGRSFGQPGGPGSVMISVTPSSCSWSLGTAASWITLTSPSSGTGNANVTYSVVSNPSSARTGALTLGGGQANYTIAQSGVPVLVWQNDSTRQVNINYFGGAGGASLIGWNYLFTGSGWHVAAVADFDGNGIRDLVWVNDTTKVVYVDYYGGPAGTDLIGFNVLYSYSTAGWHIVGAGDFNGDGVPDLVWQNDTTGQVNVNYFGGAAGASLMGFAVLYPAGSADGWRAAAIADFNGDRVPDIVWQNNTTGQVNVNYFGGPGGAFVTGYNVLYAPGTTSGWHIVAALDFDNNGTPDLVWANDTTGQVNVNYFGGSSGASLLGFNVLYPAGTTAGWSVVD